MAYANHWNSTDQIPSRAIASGEIGLYGAFDPSDGGNANRFSLSGRWAQTDEGGSSKANFYVIKSSLNLWNNFTYLGLLFHCLAGLNRYGESELRQHSQNWLNDISPTEHPLITGYRSQAQPVRFFL
jgi:hypothetical protein